MLTKQTPDIVAAAVLMTINPVLALRTSDDARDNVLTTCLHDVMVMTSCFNSDLSCILVIYQNERFWFANIYLINVLIETNSWKELAPAMHTLWLGKG